jgi:hypothetical protein
MKNLLLMLAHLLATIAKLLGPGGANVINLKKKFEAFRTYYNHHRTRSSLGGNTRTEGAGGIANLQHKLGECRWQNRCRGRCQLPIAA